MLSLIRVFGALLVLAIVALAQPLGAPPPASREAKAAIVDTVARLLDHRYVIPATGRKAADRIRTQLKKGVYDSLTTLPAFTQRLEEDLTAIAHDGHLGVQTLPPEAAERFAIGDSTAFDRRRHLDRYQNGAFEQLRILPGNVGYMKLNMFYPAEEAGATAVAAMNFLSQADALIFDLRENGGGEPSMIQLLTSYLFDHPVKLNSFATRDSSDLEQEWTYAYVPGPRLDKVPVYVLTSRYTFSGAEEFSYNLKYLKRGVIVGDTTGGGAHPVAEFFLRDWNVLVNVPISRPINAVTGTDWEGVGVIPDMPCPSTDALDVAHLAALQQIRPQLTRPQRVAAVEWAIGGLEARLHPPVLSREELARYAGSYGPRIVTLEGDTLYYQRQNGPRRRMIPIGPHRFALDGIHYFRVEFVPATDGSMATLVGRYDDGHTDESPRTTR